MAEETSGNPDAWRSFSTEERQREYSPSSCVGGDISPFLSAYAGQSQASRQACEEAGAPVVEVRYGRAASHTIDLVVPASTEPCPLVVFIHGGYWQELSKRESFFGAADCIAAGVAYAAIDYTLAPAASIDQIVQECHLAVTALRSLADSHQLDPHRLVVCGSSAGAHLAAMVGLGAPDGFRPAAVVLVSGIFELEPLIGTSINNALGLDVESARQSSPALADLAGFPPAAIAYGDNETSEFKRQSDDFAAQLVTAGVAVTENEIRSRNHFDVILDLCNPNSVLGSELYGLL